MKKFNNILIIALFIGILLPASAWTQNQNNFEISKNLDIYSTLFRELEKNYVDEISAGDLVKTGIDAMLKSLDPYTVYISEAEVEDFKFITTGQYGGIGALIQKQGDKIIVAEPYEGKPAQRFGLIAGDEIIDIDGQSVAGKTTSDVSTLLKGQPGTKVDVTLKRPGKEELITLELERDNVKIDNIPYYGMLGQDVAYIKLTSFTQNAGKEMKNAFLELKKTNELKGIILDLRGNGGGLLNEAVNITNIFIDKDKEVVRTKGKLPTKNHTYRTPNPAVDPEIPLVILVDNGSASASEIVAGAIQDHDRGVIIGQKTFGKGLVQNVIPLSYNAQAKITVAKYYIPSGRLIQEIDYSKRNNNGETGITPDSLATPYKTKNGRTVYDGHGITPDIVNDMDTLSNISYALLTKYLFFNFATKFVLENETLPPPKEFSISEEIFNSFLSFIENEGYHYSTKSEETLKKLKMIAEKEHYYADIEKEYDALVKKIEQNKKDDIIKHKEEIKKILRIELVSRYYYQKGKIISSLSDDSDIKKAIEIITEKDSYISILDGQKQESGSSN
ncbi:MAG: S41 family peptidase [Bacteroidales bacterium]|nr:S41 family peptidase [Bacteroidales bacterium]MCF8405297.1 S41 family peptidase [Bacteroidales bacterium]